MNNGTYIMNTLQIIKFHAPRHLSVVGVSFMHIKYKRRTVVNRRWK